MLQMLRSNPIALAVCVCKRPTDSGRQLIRRNRDEVLISRFNFDFDLGIEDFLDVCSEFSKALMIPIVYCIWNTLTLLGLTF